MKIGIYLSDLNKAWYGGIAYTRALTYSLRAVYGKKARIYGISHECQPGSPDEFKAVIDDSIVIPNLRRGTLQWVRNNIERRLISPHMLEERILNKNGIDVVFGQLLTKKFSRIPIISWLPDFQHINLPGFFSSEEISYRNSIFYSCAERSRAMVLMSESAKKDFKKYLPQFLDKTRVVSAVSHIPDSVYTVDPNPILSLYGLPAKFIYLPNQLWKHKNHELAFKAIKKLKTNGMEICIVCSGNQDDNRYPGYFTELSKKISDWGIKEDIKFLGMIPYEHVLILMRQSIFVLNPSLFEGFGLSASEAKSLGKRMLLSDIPAHREQNPTGAVFFKSGDIEDLADNMARLWRESKSGPNLDLEEKARKEMSKRMDECGRSFMSVMEEAINET